MLVSEINTLTEEISLLVEKYGAGRQSLLPILQEIQIRYGHISDVAQQEIARLLDIHPVEVYGVTTFYSFLNTTKRAKYNIRLCKTISCDLTNKDGIARALERELGIKFGEISSDEKYSLAYVSCLGMCDQGPAMLINNQVYSKLTPRKVVEILDQIKGR
jgi:[NiFe] hydrogenase diaphorase moiety large subunit